MAEAQWYVIHTYSGYENKVKTDLEKSAETRGMTDWIVDVAVPTHDEIETNEQGTKRVVQRKTYPGYVFVHMVMNDLTWYVVRNTNGVTGFVGPGSKPVPLTEDEVDSMGFGKTVEISRFSVGDTVEIMSGVWVGNNGVIKSINEGKQTLTINVDMFGHETPLEMSFAEVKRMQ